MNCKETVARLQTFLDRELSEAEIQEVELHLKRCPPCLNIFDFEKELKLLVKRRACPESAPLSLRERISAQLHQ
jgi:mycothiol system anti-sigma-R factor